jgi:hypothetical protein
MPKRWELKVVAETAQRRNLRGTVRAMARLQRQKAKESEAVVKRKGAKGRHGQGASSASDSGGPPPVGGTESADSVLALAARTSGMPTQQDVLEPLRFSGPMQKVHEFSGMVPPVDLTRHYALDGTCSSTVLQTYYSSE